MATKQKNAGLLVIFLSLSFLASCGAISTEREMETAASALPDTAAVTTETKPFGGPLATPTPAPAGTPVLGGNASSSPTPTPTPTPTPASLSTPTPSPTPPGATTTSAGWTNLSPSADSRRIYVSSSEGADTNDGRSQATPYRTIGRARQDLRNGFPDWIFLKRGDFFYESFGRWTISGRSATEPVVVTTYGPSSERAHIMHGSSDGFGTMGGGGSPAVIRNFALVGLHFNPHTRTGTQSCSNIAFLLPVENVLIEDVLVENCSTNMVFQADAGTRHHNITIHRSINRNAHAVGFINNGLYAWGVDGLTIRESLFDHNGWSETVVGATPTIFDHNIYIDFDNTAVTVEGNIITRAASHGMQVRSGGNVRNNLLVQNSINIFVGGYRQPEPGGTRGAVVDNVMLDAKDIDAQNARGWGIDIKHNPGAYVAGNILAHSTRGQMPIAIQIIGEASNSNNATNAIVRDNIVYNWGGSVRFEDARGANYFGSAVFENNDVQEFLANHTLLEIVNATVVGRVTSSGNRFHAALTPTQNWFWIVNRGAMLQDWRPTVQDTTSQAIAVNYPDPSRDIASYQRALGQSPTLEAFLLIAGEQSRQTWRADYTADAVNRYIRAGFGR